MNFIPRQSQHSYAGSVALSEFFCKFTQGCAADHSHTLPDLQIPPKAKAAWEDEQGQQQGVPKHSCCRASLISAQKGADLFQINSPARPTDAPQMSESTGAGNASPQARCAK